MKKYFILVILIFLAFIFSGCKNINQESMKDKIIKYVYENNETIINSISKNNFKKLENNNFIKKIDINDNYIDFYCDGYGLVPSSSYFGFYYSYKDRYDGLWIIDTNKLLKNETGYYYKEEDGDNYYYTEKIMKKLYYYEMHF